MKKYRVQYKYTVIGWCDVDAKTKKEALENITSSDDFGTDEECGIIKGLKAKELK